jgi:hypothetical protein
VPTFAQETRAEVFPVYVFGHCKEIGTNLFKDLSKLGSWALQISLISALYQLHCIWQFEEL